MELLDFEETGRLSREAAAERLRAIADALERHNGLSLQRGGKTVDVRVPDVVDFELEVEIESGGGSIEIELSW